MRLTRQAVAVGLVLIIALLLIDANRLPHPQNWFRGGADVGIRNPDDPIKLRLIFEETPRTTGEFIAEYTVNGNPSPVWLESRPRSRKGSVILTLKRRDVVTTRIYRSGAWSRIYCAIRDAVTNELIDQNERTDDAGSIRCYYPVR